MSEAQGFAHPEFLAETDWLAAHLNDPNVIVLDGTVHLIPDPKITYTVKSGREDFEKGHIPRRRRNGRPASGGCCATTASTMPRS